MDGTLVDSTAGVVGAWTEFKKTYPNIEVHDILSSAHGVRTVDNLKRYCGLHDPIQLEKEAERFENAIITTASEDGRPGLLRLPGVTRVFEEYRTLPSPLWTIVTSATNVYCRGALEATKIPVPEALVVAEDVKDGKPSPEPYLLGAMKVGARPEDCVVFEDAPSGIRSGNAAGCKTIAVITSHTREQLEAASPTYIIQDLSKIQLKRTEDGIEIVLEL
ncbi:phosphatase [Flagelloscypha sp. PMI_526]|nr:phosphatase [Flagelloscypha sp. PMI_526]